MANGYRYVELTGVIVPDTADVRAEVEAEFRQAFGQDLRVTPDTPQGVLITGETRARSDVLAFNATIANQINPDLAGGVFLDALCAMLGLFREAATRTLVRDVTVTGQPGTPLPAGIRARTAAGDLFQSVGGVTLDGTGTATVDFQAVDTGPIPCAVGALNTVVDMVLGWETVLNAFEGSPGVAEESDESLRQRRRVTLARQGISTVEAQVSDLYAVPNVRSLQYRENIAATTQVIDGITMVAHSVWACVDGGLDLDIATSLLNNKTDGAAWNGAVSVPVLEPFSGQTYTVLFDRPDLIPVLVRVTVRRGTTTIDLQTAVRDAVMAWANNVIPGEQGLAVGVPVSPYEIAGAVSISIPGLFVAKVEVALASTSIYQPTELAVALNELATLTSSSITVVEL